MEGEEGCRRRLVSKTKVVPAGLMLPLPLQFLEAWASLIVYAMASFFSRRLSTTGTMTSEKMTLESQMAPGHCF